MISPATARPSSDSFLASLDSDLSDSIELDTSVSTSSGAGGTVQSWLYTVPGLIAHCPALWR